MKDLRETIQLNFPRPSSDQDAELLHDPEAFGDSESEHYVSMRPADKPFQLPSRLRQPPVEVLRDLVEVYRTVIHFQPLPLFDPDDLLSRLTVFPQYLLWSFLALTLAFTSHEFYRNHQADAIELYACLAKDTVMKEAVEGSLKREVVQSLCLLSLKEIKGKCTRFQISYTYPPTSCSRIMY